MLSLNDDDDDAKALPTGVPKDDAMKKGEWGGQNVSKSDDVILVCSLRREIKEKSMALKYLMKILHEPELEFRPEHGCERM